ncbi:EpsD family peptidyl-prolyl cis-trans isomerase [Rhodoferax lacus]|nr:EpsD family peptidyl-prolyl cis-trans isomerase [Rhodoferax lacus]
MKHLLKATPHILLASAMAFGLVACGKSEDKKVATQVAAKVGSEEISVHQINQVLNNANTKDATPDTVKKMSREVLEKLIDQQLAISQATEKKLDRSPDVVGQIESAKRDILARAYVQQLVASLPKPTAEEAKKYYAEHPQLFSERRVFNVQELIMPNQEGLAEQLGTLNKAGKSTEDIANYLKGKDIKFNGGAATRTAEQIPMDLLNKLQPLKDGQSLLAQTPQTITLIHLASSKTVPVDEATALPRIEQFLGNQRANEAIASNMKGLRQSAKIEYMGEFAKSDAAPAVSAAASQPAPAAKAEDQNKATLEKGIAGLK